MTKTIELDVAQSTLSEIIAGLAPDDEIVIVQDHKPVARLVAPPLARQPRRPGLFKDVITVISETER